MLVTDLPFPTIRSGCPMAHMVENIRNMIMKWLVRLGHMTIVLHDWSDWVIWQFYDMIGQIGWYDNCMIWLVRFGHMKNVWHDWSDWVILQFYDMIIYIMALSQIRWESTSFFWWSAWTSLCKCHPFLSLPVSFLHPPVVCSRIKNDTICLRC